jgi:hypothetical protein
MVASFHLPLTDVMTERPCEMLHMDLVAQLVCDLRVGSGMPCCGGRLFSVCVGVLSQG